MKFKRTTIAAFLGTVLLATSANAQVTVCESDGRDVSAKIVFQPYSAGRMEALTMEYQGRNVMGQRLSIFNHMGVILFKGSDDVDFHSYEGSDEFHVTAPAAHGVRLIMARGRCSQL